jgi:hypothetical protein
MPTNGGYAIVNFNYKSHVRNLSGNAIGVKTKRIEPNGKYENPILVGDCVRIKADLAERNIPNEV